MIKVFMSYGMHGRTEEEQKAARNRVKKKIERYFAGKKVWYSLKDNRNAVTNGGRLSYLGLAIQKMDKCNAIAFDDDWMEHKGCVIEHHVAELYGLEIIEA